MQNETKGVYAGTCNRQGCNNPHALYFNYSTRKYYCLSCAHLLNDANKRDAFKEYGHDLCLKGYHVDFAKLHYHRNSPLEGEIFTQIDVRMLHPEIQAFLNSNTPVKRCLMVIKGKKKGSLYIINPNNSALSIHDRIDIEYEK